VANSAAPSFVEAIALQRIAYLPRPKSLNNAPQSGVHFFSLRDSQICQSIGYRLPFTGVIHISGNCLKFAGNCGFRFENSLF